MAALLNALGSSTVLPNIQGMIEAAYNGMKEKQKANFQCYTSGQVPK